MPTTKTAQPVEIHFEDHHQDFLRWTVDAEGNVTDCWPFQGWLWCQYKVTNLKSLKVGGYVRVRKGQQRLTIKYRITELKEVAQAAA